MISTFKPRYIELSYDLLHQKYVIEKLNTREIAAQFFSSNSRIRDALKANNIPLRKRKNMSFNRTNTPFGKRLLANGKLEDCPREMEAIQLMIRLKTQNSTYKAICEELEKRGIKTKMGRTKWSSESIKRAIDRGV